MTFDALRFSLARPTAADAAALYEICSDPRVWTHFPSLRHTELEQSQAMVDRWMAGWDRDGLGTWVVRDLNDQSVIGYGGCSVAQETFWNLGYRFAFDAQGQGFATELAVEAVTQAKASRPDLPVVAYLLEHNAASARVAQKVGLSLVHRGFDAGNPDADAVRLVYADRPLSVDELEVAMR